MTKLMEIEGIGEVQSKKLQKAGIETVETLLEKGASPKGRKEIAAQSGVDGALILRWVNHADLFRVKGIGPQYAELLEAAGVDTVVELAKRVPASLCQKMTELNATTNKVNKLPAEKLVADWVAQAKQLPRVVAY